VTSSWPLILQLYLNSRESTRGGLPVQTVGGIIKSLLSVRNPDVTKCGVGHHEGISDALVNISYSHYDGTKPKRVLRLLDRASSL